MEKYTSGLSMLLNVLDGANPSHGRIILMTTNCPEKLDAAIKRPGRVDVQLEMSYVTQEVFTQFMKSYYPDYSYDEEAQPLSAEGITPADLQKMAKERKTAEEVVYEYTTT